MRNNRNRGLELGVVLLFSELLNAGFGVIPPVTLAAILGQTLLYMGLIQVPWERWDVCISAENVWKARSLEPRYGSTNFGILLLFLTLLTSAFYVTLGLCCANILHDAYYLRSCAIGFSGVIFALKVLATMEASHHSDTSIAGFRMPSKYAPWAELILIHLMVPNASFMGHLAGILAGLAYTSTPIGTLVDSVITGVTGRGMWHEWTARRYHRY